MKRSLPFRCRARCLDSGELIDVLVIFFGSSSVDIDVIDDEFQNALKSKDPIPDAVLLLSYGDTASKLKAAWVGNPERACGLVKRGRPDDWVYLKEVAIWSFRDGQFEKIHRDDLSVATYRLNVGNLLSRGFADLVDSRAVFQEAPPRHVFKHPSRRKSKHFFVVTELLQDEIDAYFAALLLCALSWQRIRSTSSLHIDTMAIYPIARAVSDVAAASGGQSAPWEIHSFHSHGGMQGLYKVVQRHEVVIISASTSGSMAATLVDEGVSQDAVVTLLDIAYKDRKGVIVYARERHPTAPLKSLTGAEEVVIELAGEYFSPRGKKPRPFTLSLDHRPTFLGLALDHFGSADTLRLNGARASGLGIDVLSLSETAVVASPEFQEWLADEICSKTPVSVSHIVPVPGAGGTAMSDLTATLLQKLAGRACEVVPALEIRRLEPAQVSGVLVCAPVIGNGHVVRSLARDLRELVPKASRHFVVGVGMPETASAWTRLNQFLTQSGMPTRPYAFSNWISIPTGSAPGVGAAWGRAASLMQRLDQVPRIACPFWDLDCINASMDILGDALESAQQEFLPNSSGAKLQLTRGFVYWDPSAGRLKQSHHAAVSFLAMSSALQAAREYSNPVNRLATTVHESVVLDPENFMRFNDGVLQASILRASMSHELDYSGAPDLSELMREFMEKVFINNERSYGEASLEFALALASGHLRLMNPDKERLLQLVAKYCKGPAALVGLLYCYWVDQSI